jgi:hypothetical protein
VSAVAWVSRLDSHHTSLLNVFQLYLLCFGHVLHRIDAVYAGFHSEDSTTLRSSVRRPTEPFSPLKPSNGAGISCMYARLTADFRSESRQLPVSPRTVPVSPRHDHGGGKLVRLFESLGVRTILVGETMSAQHAAASSILQHLLQTHQEHGLRA